MTDDELDRAFFLESGSPQLEKIHQWARARYAAPRAVLGAVLLRVAASVGPHVQLPGLIGGRASLNLLCAFVSASGGGKGISDKVARLAWPTDILELPIGSGEGIAATFKRPDKPSEDDEPITAAIFNIPEVDTLAGIAARQGSILLAQLKSMAMGEQLGQSNASKATSRVVQAHTYRCCLSVGAQPMHTGVLFDDTTGGTPQRFLWFPTIDPTMPEERAPDPEPLDTTMPSWNHRTDGSIVEIQYGPAEIAQTIIAAHLARQRGQADALDGHAMLTRCKVAAVLAIMHGRGVVSEWDWARSADVMAISDHTREWIVTEAKRAARAKIHDRALSRARGEEFVSEHKLQRAKSAVIRWLGRDTELAANQVRSKLKADLRDHFGAAIAELVSDGLVIEIQVDRGSRYRLSAEVQGVPQVQGIYPQLSDGVPVVQGVPPASVIELDTRRSPDHLDDNPREATRGRVSCQQWFDNHIAELRRVGNTTAESFAVFANGLDAGYTRANLNKATKAAGLTVIARTNTSTTWSLTGDHQAYVTAGDWLSSYLHRLDVETVDPDDVKAAGAAAGYDWETLRRAASRSPRIDSEPAHGDSKNERIWQIIKADTA